MNSSDIKTILLAYNELFKSTKHINDVRFSLTNEHENDTFNKEQVEKIVKEYNQRLIALEKFERELDKVEKFMKPDVFKLLKEALSNEKFVLSRLLSSANGYLEIESQDFLDEVISNFAVEKETSFMLDKQLKSFSNDLTFNLLLQTYDKEISVEELESLMLEIEKDCDIYNRVDFVVDTVEKFEEEKETEETVEPDISLDDTQPAEVETIDNVINSTPSEEVAESAIVSEEPELTLEEKIEKINYKLGDNLNQEVQEITSDDKLSIIETQIAKLQTKEKLTVRETFQLRQLIEQQLAFQTYKDDLEHQKVSFMERRRDKKLGTTIDQIDSKSDKLQSSLETSSQYTSKLMRFVSERYQKGLTDKLESLRAKQGILVDRQKASALARFDKKSKKLIRKAIFKGTIEQLKEYRDSIIQEVINVGKDVSRFCSTKQEDMELLTNSFVIMPDNVISLEGRRALTYGGMVA